MKYFLNSGIRLTVFTATVAFSVFTIQAQNECPSFGWVNYDGQTEKGPVTGGGTGTPVEVSSFSALKSAVESSSERVIYVMNDMGAGYRGTSGDVLNFKSNKTVIGIKPGITVKCSFQIKNASNIIVKNLICRGPGNSNSEQNWDAVCIQGSKRIWFDHCTVMEGEDGNFDVIKGSDNVTASWCKFTYVTGGNHNLSNLIGSSDNEDISHGKLNVTFACCWWDNVNSRCPRTRYGKIHVLNSYYSNVGSGAFAGFMSNIRVEGCYFESTVGSPTGLISTGGQAGVFTLDCNVNGTKTDGFPTAFTPPYTFKKIENSQVKSTVTDPKNGAGPTLSVPTQCGSTGVTFEIQGNENKISSISVKVTDNISVDLNLKKGDAFRMCLFDVTGRKVADMKSISTHSSTVTSTLNVKNVRSGAYILNVSTNGRVTSQKIIKNQD